MKRLEFTPAMDLSLRQGWLESEPVEQLIDRLGVSRSSLYRRAKHLQLEPRRPTQPSGYYRRPKVYPHAHPLVRGLFDEARAQQVNLTQITEAAGVNRETIGSWGNHSSPLVVNLEAAANYLGLKLCFSKGGRLYPGP